MRRWLKFRRFQGKRVTLLWFVIFTEAVRKGIRFTLTSGKRTMREQWVLFKQNMIRIGVPKPGRPLTAFPSPTAPHIRKGWPNHANDVNSLDGGETRLEAWLERNGVDWQNTVPGETWHGEAPLHQLIAFATRILRDKAARDKAKRKRKREARERKVARRKQGIARANGAQFVGITWDACQKEDVPFALGLALLEKETGFDNEYGHDVDSATGLPVWHGTSRKVVVTKENVKDYLRFAKRTGKRQGVGPVQLTSAEYQERAEREGGLHKAEVTIPIGIDILRGHIEALGTRKGIGAFNGGRGNPQLDYADDVIKLWDKWRRKFSRKGK